ncbi:aminotransferase class I/II-fold pyridoxal phosphate-dependent enzyme [Pseudalkalibacillus caeni]|uniref:Aminotransferase class I/II-fold pyridoxal phosphate-dependent enzyme n=1 Tax=Exobacillus caeni TaxID=2574798 RepID=A0A5R9EWV7_9BACL|nr:aminotransferase class I/II-fold pyridoxal phosphate-dependent enzyme [Pseudalkalibacillus caeni]TLS35089.1 aminotransferase class I/II-fold pyridoxal phosphate-dependent enzyme [Pseudalkalibacillus caeni]
MDQQRAPLFEALVNWSERNPISFHVPGHKNGDLFADLGDKHFKDILKIDATELNGLDDLHDPREVIGEAQKLTAAYYGAENSYFLVGGSTAGNLAMILGTCKEGDHVLVQRNSHKSILNGLLLAGVKPYFLSPEIDPVAKVATGVADSTVKQALSVVPDAKAIILTNPNYYGMTVELENIVQYAHARNIPVLVDEAHGAHFRVSSSFPLSALEVGADVVVQSAHKTLPAMTMGSYLHVNSNLIVKSRIERYLRMLQSSSPSYPIMASLDLARYYLASLTEDKVKKILSSLFQFREEIKDIPGFRVIEPSGPVKKIDPLKITIQCKDLPGYQLQKLLEKENIYIEMADPLNVLLVLPLTDNSLQEGLLEKLKKITRQNQTSHQAVERYKDYPAGSTITELAASYRELSTCEKQVVPISAAKGKIAGQAIVPYPPGIPLVLEGERITGQHLKALQHILSSGGKVQGLVGEGRKQIEIYVIKETGQ